MSGFLTLGGFGDKLVSRDKNRYKPTASLVLSRLHPSNHSTDAAGKHANTASTVRHNSRRDELRSLEMSHVVIASSPAAVVACHSANDCTVRETTRWPPTRIQHHVPRDPCSYTAGSNVDVDSSAHREACGAPSKATRTQTDTYLYMPLIKHSCRLDFFASRTLSRGMMDCLTFQAFELSATWRTSCELSNLPIATPTAHTTATLTLCEPCTWL